MFKIKMKRQTLSGARELPSKVHLYLILSEHNTFWLPLSDFWKREHYTKTDCKCPKNNFLIFIIL